MQIKDWSSVHSLLKGVDLAPSFGARRGIYASSVKNKTKQNKTKQNKTKQNKGIQTYQILTNDDKVLFQVFLVFS